MLRGDWTMSSDEDTIYDPPDGQSAGNGRDATMQYSPEEMAKLVSDADLILEPDTVLGKYRIIRHLASGAMGHVYEAEHTILRKRHALKVIKRKFAIDENFVSRFRYEARVMAALEHENIVRVTDFGTESGFHYFVMDYVIGPNGSAWTLQDKLGLRDDMQPLPEEEVRELFFQICNALAFSHSFGNEGIVHRDLKPSNIMLREDGRVAVADFGLARMVGNDDGFTSVVRTDEETVHLRTEEIAGTPRFMSPEQWQFGAILGPASDIYSVGIMLYLSLTGSFPYPDSRALIGEGPGPSYPLPSSFGCDKAWDEIVTRCLQRKPEDRFESADELRGAIRAMGRPPARRISSGALVASVVATIALLGGVLYVASTRPAGESGPVAAAPADDLVPGPAPEAIVEPPAPMVESAPPPVPAPPAAPLPTGQVRILMTMVEGEGGPGVLPTEGELKVDNEPWRPVFLPHVQDVASDTPHILVLRAPGFGDETSVQVSVEENGRTECVFAMTPQPARITITCNQEGAGIFLGEEEIGVVGSPLVLKPFRTVRLSIRHPGYMEREIELNLSKPDARYGDYFVELEPLPTVVHVDVKAPDFFKRPKQVGVVLDGENLGEQAVPLVLKDREPGPHSLSIIAAGFKEVAPQTVEFIRGETKEIVIALEYLDTFARFKVTPEEARIIYRGKVLEGRELAVRPDAFETVKVEADGYEPLTLTISVRPGQTREFPVALKAYSYFEFNVNPPDASIFMRGGRVNESKVKVDPNVEYTVDIRARNRKAFEGRFTAGEGETKLISVDLEKKGFGR